LDKKATLNPTQNRKQNPRKHKSNYFSTPWAF